MHKFYSRHIAILLVLAHVWGASAQTNKMMIKKNGMKNPLTAPFKKLAPGDYATKIKQYSTVRQETVTGVGSALAFKVIDEVASFKDKNKAKKRPGKKGVGRGSMRLRLVSKLGQVAGLTVFANAIYRFSLVETGHDPGDIPTAEAITFYWPNLSFFKKDHGPLVMKNGPNPDEVITDSERSSLNLKTINQKPGKTVTKKLEAKK